MPGSKVSRPKKVGANFNISFNEKLTFKDVNDVYARAT